MFLIRKNGERVHVNNELQPLFREKCVLYDDAVGLTEAWVVTVFKTSGYDGNVNQTESEYAGEFVFDHQPTEDEIIYALSYFECGRFDYATVERVYRLGYVNEE